MSGWWIAAFLFGTVGMFGNQIAAWIHGLAFRMERYSSRLAAFNNASDDDKDRMGPFLRPVAGPLRLIVRLRYGKEALLEFDRFLAGK